MISSSRPIRDAQAGRLRRCRLMIVDDSAAIVNVLRHGLARHPEIEVIATASDAYEAREKIRTLDPDVITLDVEMPRMSGLDFLERIMRLRPMPVVMFSSVTTAGSDAAVRALSLGAVDVIVKPQGGLPPNLIDDMAMRILAAAGSLRRIDTGAKGLRAERPIAKAGSIRRWNGRIVMIGASTGGVAALETVLAGLPVNCAPTVISQHMPDSFLRSFVSRLNDRNVQRVVLAEPGLRVDRGMVVLAPGGAVHTGVALRDGAFYITEISGPKTNGHYPSVDELFASGYPFADRIIGVILTGLGRDGANGLAQLKKRGAWTIGQSRETSVVYGMPRAAAELGALTCCRDLSDIAGEICRMSDQSYVVQR